MNAVLFTIQAATNAARQRTGDKRIAVAVKAGRYQITTVEYLPSGASVVNEISEPLTFVEVLDALATVTTH